MSVPIHFHKSRVTIGGSPSKTPFVVPAGTPLLDVVLRLGQSGLQYALVCDDRSSIVGIVSQTDLLQYMAAVDRDDVDRWKSRPVEDLMTTRFQESPFCGKDIGKPDRGAHVRVPCVSLVEQGRLSGFITDDDVFLSWSRLEPMLRAANTDDLTKLANRNLFMRRLSEEWDRSNRSGEPLALLLFDVDYFKEINDQCGHMAGDTLLTDVGRIMRESLRSYDVVARIGGDEFAALCCNCNPDSIEIPIRRIQGMIRNRNTSAPWMQRGLTLSIGAAVVRSGFEDLSIETVYSHADACLYRAKAAGRDCAFQIVLDGATESSPECIDRELVESQDVR